jgi:hypothetical protein
MRRLFPWRRLVLLLAILVVLPQPGAADDESDYTRAVAAAKANALAPVPWTVRDLKVITGAGTGDGNTYIDGKLLAATFTKESYFWKAHAGKTMTVHGAPATSATWVTIGDELKSHLARIGATAGDVKRETSRALGMSATNADTMIVELLVTPSVDFIQRPTRDPSVASQPTSLGTNAAFDRPAGMSDAAFTHFKAYYDDWLASAYAAGNFPWSQLGYTYVWGRGDALPDIRGLSEFIMPGGTNYTVHAMYALASYLYTTGNGSGDFHVTGNLDTLWTGRMFQPQGNTVVVDAGATVAGGQGLLVTSPGYLVANNGVITGPTNAKFNLPASANVAVLFLSQNPPNAKAAATSKANTLANGGTIESPGTAVLANADDTTVIVTGKISGGHYAIQTGDGADTVIVQNGSLSGTVDLGAGQDSLIVSGNSTLAFALSPLGATLPIQNVETVTIGQGTTLALTFADAGRIANGQTFTLVRAKSLTTPQSGLSATSNLPKTRLLTTANEHILQVTVIRD